jgi:hypothetical protein
MKSNFFNFYQIALFFAISIGVFVSCNQDDEKEDPYDVVIDFQDVDIPDGTYINDAGAKGCFEKGIVSFQNSYEDKYDPEWDFSYPYWYGFAYSQMHNTEKPGFENEFSAYVLNDSPDNKFMVGYFASWESPSIDITFSQPIKDLSFDVANTTWTALAMKDGDDFTKKFVDSDDWLELKIKAISTDGTETITIPLGKGTLITNMWNPIQVQSKNITQLEFSLASSDEGVPTYFCIDNIKARKIK